MYPNYICVSPISHYREKTRLIMALVLLGIYKVIKLHLFGSRTLTYICYCAHLIYIYLSMMTYQYLSWLMCWVVKINISYFFINFIHPKTLSTYWLISITVLLKMYNILHMYFLNFSYLVAIQLQYCTKRKKHKII